MTNLHSYRQVTYQELVLCILEPYIYVYTVEPPNKGHLGDNINSAVLSFVERLFSSRRFKMY